MVFDSCYGYGPVSSGPKQSLERPMESFVCGLAKYFAREFITQPPLLWVPARV